MSDRIVLAHGGGGLKTDELLRDVILPRLGAAGPDDLSDSALLRASGLDLAFTTDGYVVRPLEFPGGDIGRLAVAGTVNDLAVAGARPMWLSLGLVLEEGLSIEVLGRILESAAASATEAGVRIVTGDTKVVPRGQADGMYVTTAGVGEVVRRLPGARAVRPGDRLLVSGTLGDHGLAVMLARGEGPSLSSRLESDVAPLAGLVGSLLAAVPETVFLRDPTRAGLAGVAADLARESGLRLVIEEARLPVRSTTRYAADLLGLDILTVANEGKIVAVVRESDTDRALDCLRAHSRGREAAIVGRFEKGADGIAELLTEAGGRRMIRKPYGEDLPRIC